MCMCVHVCVRACVRACVHVCICWHVCLCVCVTLCIQSPSSDIAILIKMNDLTAYIYAALLYLKPPKTVALLKSLGRRHSFGT